MDTTEGTMPGETQQDMGMEQDMDKEQEMSLEQVDQDGDGNVSWGELQQEAGEMVKEDKFQEFDKDGDGVLGEDEFEEAKSFIKEKKSGEKETY
ncbi:MAG: hypothetical protein ACLFTB_04525 [Desulfovibrionales bacterium]